MDISGAYVERQIQHERRYWPLGLPPISVAYVSKRPTKPRTDKKAEHRKAQLTDADRAASRNLERIWDALPAKEKPTQEQMIQAFDRHGLEISQSAISQMKNGAMAITFRHLLVFAGQLGCEPKDIRDDLPEMQLLAWLGWTAPRSGPVVGELRNTREDAPNHSPFSFDDELWDQWKGLEPEKQKEIEGMVTSMVSSLILIAGGKLDAKKKKPRKRFGSGGSQDELQ